jgi:hypothetical protein
MTRPSHLFVAHNGNLYDTRDSQWSTKPPLRRDYARGFPRITSAAQFKAVLRSGPYTDLGGYPLALICDDGAALCFDCAKRNLRNILPTYRDNSRDGWRVVCCEVNYDDAELTCEQCNAAIPSAYGDD